MSRIAFRGLVSLEILLLVFFWSVVFTSAGNTSTAEIQEASTKTPLTATLALLAATLFEFTGLIGMLLLQGWGRHPFALGLAISMVTSAAAGRGDASSAMTTLLAGVYWVNAGAVLGLSYTPQVWGTLRRLSDV